MGSTTTGEVTNLFQGEAPVHPREHRGEVYPGDRAKHDDENVTIQIHMLDLSHDKLNVAQNVPVSCCLGSRRGWAPVLGLRRTSDNDRRTR